MRCGVCVKHDPLCPWVRDPWWDKSCVVCDLIARVRADEQSKRDKRQYESYANARKVGRQDGYIAALHFLAAAEVLGKKSGDDK